MAFCYIVYCMQKIIILLSRLLMYHLILSNVETVETHFVSLKNTLRTKGINVATNYKLKVLKKIPC